ncbi:hypothetical protein U9M48_034768, partial [Paspalum notatum var. saurae]
PCRWATPPSPTPFFFARASDQPTTVSACGRLRRPSSRGRCSFRRCCYFASTQAYPRALSPPHACAQSPGSAARRRWLFSPVAGPPLPSLPVQKGRDERFIPPMLQWWCPKCPAEWFRHRKFFPWEVSSRSFSVVGTSAQFNDSSGDEKLNCDPDNEPVHGRHQSLSSDSVVQTLRCLRRKPAVAFAYFKDTQTLGFRHDFSTYSEIVQVLSHSFQTKMLVSLFCEIISSADRGGPEILTLMDHLRKTCATFHVLSFAVNCLIKAYTSCHDAQATIEMFCRLCRLGFAPSVWACNFLLKFVSQGGDSDMVVTAYDQMKCFQLTLDAHSMTIVTRSLFLANKADKALQVWVTMIEMGVKPDVHGYSSFIIGLCDCGKYDLAYSMVSRCTVLQEITQERVPIEAMAYNMVIDGLCKEMKLAEAEKVLESKAKHGSPPDIYGHSYLIHSYSKMGNLEKVCYHIEAMVSHGIEINCHIVGCLLQCLRKLGMISEVIVHFHKFRDSGLHPDGVLYNIAMDAYCKLGDMNEAVKLLNEMMAGGLAPDKIHYTCLINGYCLKGETENAWQAFEHMLKENIKPDVVTYNILANGYSRNGLVMKVFDLLEHMMDQGLEPNSLTYGVAIAGFCRGGNLSEAEVLFNIVEEKGIDNIEVMYSSMVCGYLHSGWTDHAYVLFLRVAKQGNMVDRFSCSKLINGLCRDGKVEGASTVCSMMLEKNVIPDVISYSNIISAYCQRGDMRNAHLWFHDMVERGLSDVIVYTVLMNGYCKVGRMREACELFDKMINVGIKPDIVAYTVLLDGHLKETLRQGWQGIAKEERSFLLRAKHKRVLSHMKDMEIEPDVICYTVLIDGQCKADFLDGARRLFDEMLAKGLTPDVYTYTALINGYCSQGETSKAEDLLQEMVDKGMKPDVLSFSYFCERREQQKLQQKPKFYKHFHAFQIYACPLPSPWCGSRPPEFLCCRHHLCPPVLRRRRTAADPVHLGSSVGCKMWILDGRGNHDSSWPIMPMILMEYNSFCLDLGNLCKVARQIKHASHKISTLLDWANIKLWCLDLNTTGLSGEVNFYYYFNYSINPCFCTGYNLTKESTDKVYR